MKKSEMLNKLSEIQEEIEDLGGCLKETENYYYGKMVVESVIETENFNAKKTDFRSELNVVQSKEVISLIIDLKNKEYIALAETLKEGF